MTSRYKQMFDIELEEHIKKECNGPFAKLLIGLVQANRTDWKTEVKVDKCKRDAEALYKAGEGQWGIETSEFRRILNLRSVPQLRCIFDQYSKVPCHSHPTTTLVPFLCWQSPQLFYTRTQLTPEPEPRLTIAPTTPNPTPTPSTFQISKRSIEESCKKEMKGHLLKAVKKIIRFAQDPYSFYAREIYKSMKGFGTDDRTLVHLIVDRCEVDMVEIKAAFVKNHKATMASWIKSDTSFEYKECLLALIRES